MNPSVEKNRGIDTVMGALASLVLPPFVGAALFSGTSTGSDLSSASFGPTMAEVRNEVLSIKSQNEAFANFSFNGVQAMLALAA